MGSEATCRNGPQRLVFEGNTRRMKRNRLWWPMLLICQTLFINGCTSVLWNKNTFAHYYEPAHPTNLRLFYSSQERELLVQYDEARDGDAPVRRRAYYADRNAERVNNHCKPSFTSAPDWQTLHPIPISNIVTAPVPTSFQGLCAASSSEGDSFTLYSKGEKLESYNLPNYVGTSRRLKQVLLTPFAVVIDCTIVGAVAAYYCGPSMLSALNGRSL